jgi:hypothetical protein
MAKKWPEKVIQRSFIKEHSFVNRLYVHFKILISFKIVVIFNITSADFFLMLADVVLKMTTILKEMRFTQLSS